MAVYSQKTLRSLKTLRVGFLNSIQMHFSFTLDFSEYLIGLGTELSG